MFKHTAFFKNGGVVATRKWTKVAEIFMTILSNRSNYFLKMKPIDCFHYARATFEVLVGVAFIFDPGMHISDASKLIPSISMLVL